MSKSIKTKRILVAYFLIGFIMAFTASQVYASTFTITPSPQTQSEALTEPMVIVCADLSFDNTAMIYNPDGSWLNSVSTCDDADYWTQNQIPFGNTDEGFGVNTVGTYIIIDYKFNTGSCGDYTDLTASEVVVQHPECINGYFTSFIIESDTPQGGTMEVIGAGAVGVTGFALMRFLKELL